MTHYDNKRDLLISIAEELGLKEEANILKTMPGSNESGPAKEYLEVKIPYEEIESISFDGKTYSMDEFSCRFKEEWPNLVEHNNYITLIICTSTGEVTNWTYGKEGIFRNVKVCDTGCYTLFYMRGGERVIIGSNFEDYVPECLEIDDSGYGEFLEFTIDRCGTIKGWSFTDEMRTEIVND